MIAAPLSRVYWKVLSKFNILPGEERAERLNDAQVLWCYLNIIEDEKEKQNKVYKQMKYLSWYIHPRMAKWVKDREDNKEKYSMKDDDFTSVIISDMKRQGISDDEIYDTLEAMGLIKE